ncbi:Ig-like domain-containing protein [Archangium gephyra]|uniref:Ig-like domain-containing protein n=1 Tax=Archangium gephyra TaxID=48 RepID=UPI003B7A861F
MTARAYDAAGNVGISPQVVVTVVTETTPPSVSLTAPASGATLGGTVTLSADATDASSSVSRVEFLMDGTLLGTDTSWPYSFSWNTLTVASGSHTLTARATDAQGNVATSAAVNVLVDNAAPAVALTSPSGGATLSGVLSLQADATDDVGVSRVDFLLDGALVGSDSTAPFGVDWDSGATADGSHTLTARAYDATNKVTTSAGLTVTTAQPVSAVYDATLRVPTCATPVDVCDTTNLVRSRRGLEPNLPNTLNGTCRDGEAESGGHFINRIKLSTVEGGPFTAGQRVRIEVHTGTYAVASAALDLFYTGDATLPTWTYLTTLKPTAAAQVLSAEYVLPAGFLQAVRAQFRMNGDSSSACSRGFYDDHDDVAFAVLADPVVKLTSPSNDARVKGVVPVSVTAAGASPVTRIEFYADGTLLGTDTSVPYELSWDSTTVADGPHALTARAYDTEGRVGTSPALPVNVDNTLPDAAITSPAPGTYFASSSVVIEATATDNQAVSKVEFYRGTTLLGTDTSAPYTMTWSTASNGVHPLTVKAHDLAGNVRTSAEVTVSVDLNPPAAAISAPAHNAWVRGLVPVSITASDSIGVARVELYVDGALLGTDTSAPYAVSWDSTTVADGAHSLTARAYDHVGRMGTSAAVTVNTDSTAPDAALTSPAPGTYLRGHVTLEATASDSRGVTKVEFYSGTTLLGTATTAPYALLWNTSGVTTSGAQTLTVKAFDSAGNVRTSAGVPVTVDNTVPVTAVSAPAHNAQVRGTVVVSATASDNVGVQRVEFYAGPALLGTATTAPYSVNWDTATLANGSVSLTTKAYDLAGNVTVSTALRTVTVDNTAPTVAITSPANGTSFSFLTFSTTLQASASDNVGVTQVVFYDGATVIGTDTTAPYSVSWNVGSVPNGTHTLTAKAHDAAGNVTTSAPISVKVN